jgi:hypothetical protein
MDSYKTRSLEKAKQEIKDDLVKSNYTSDDIYESAINFYVNYSHKLNSNIFVKIHLSVIYSIYKYLKHNMSVVKCKKRRQNDTTSKNNKIRDINKKKIIYNYINMPTKVVKPVNNFRDLQFLPSVKNASKLKEKDIFEDDNTPVDIDLFNKNNAKRNAQLKARVEKRKKKNN